MVSHGSVMKARKTESIEADDAHAVHWGLSTWMGMIGPAHWEAKGFVSLRAGASSSELEAQG